MPVHHYLKRRTVAPRDSQDMSWMLNDLLAVYAWPSGLKGGGRIGIVELGGAYSDADTTAFCAANSFPVPTVSHVYLDGAAQTTMQDDASGEVALDVQVAAGAYSKAVGSAADVTLFWAKDLASTVRAATAAGNIDVFSISWGQDEAGWGTAALDDMEDAIATATAAGMAVTVAAGDNDSSDGGPGAANVDGPASCPHAIACGGTKRFPRNVTDPATREVVWNDDPGQANGSGTGGGFSTVFGPQAWQVGGMPGPGRMVPDVAANADPVTGYRIWLDGQETVVGGTSAVAPLYAGLIAAFGPKPGWISPLLWQSHLSFNLITQGDNGAFRAGPLPSPTCGLGSPIGTRLAALLAKG